MYEWASRMSPAVVLKPPVIALATFLWTDLSLFVTLTEPRMFFAPPADEVACTIPLPRK